MDDPRPRNALLSEEEPLADYLKRRERELTQQTAALRGMLLPKEKQLEEIRQAMKAIGIQPGYVEQLLPFLDQSGAKVGVLNQSTNEDPYVGVLKTGEQLTIKEMIMGALNHHFQQGATPSELSEYMRTAYGREIDRNSVSPQLARLREEGLVENTNALNGKWMLTLRADLTRTLENIDQVHSERSRRWYGSDKKKD
jgi:hypothetical protein